MEDIFFKFVLTPMLTFLAVFTVYTMAVWMPFYLVDEAQCLEAGYPKTSTAFNLKGYCMNLEGTVTVKVQSLEK